MSNERLALRAGRRNTEGWEGLPDQIWTLISEGLLLLGDVIFYLLARFHWRSFYADPECPRLILPRPFTRQFLGLGTEGHLRCIEKRLERIGWISIHTSAGPKAKARYGLFSVYERDAWLDKQRELQQGHFDRVHHGVLTTFGDPAATDSIRRYFAMPLLTPEGVGVYLYLLHRANMALVKQLGKSRHGDSGAARQPNRRIEMPVREIDAALHICLDNYEEDLAMLERLGWIVRERVSRVRTNYDIAEAPSTLVGVLVAIYVALEGADFGMIEYVMDALSRETMSLADIVDRVTHVGGIELTPYGVAQAEAELRFVRNRFLHPQGDGEKEALEFLWEIGMQTDEIVGLSQQYGQETVFEFTRRAQSRMDRGRIRQPDNWIRGALRKSAIESANQ